MSKNKCFYSFACALVISSNGAFAAMDHSKHMGHGEHAANPALHVHHTHSQGSWMFEFRTMRMTMDNLIQGDNEIASDSILQPGAPNPSAGTFPMTPTSMTMDMHMLMAMYGFTDKITAMVMFHYLDNQMDMLNAASLRPSMSTSGAGDTTVSAMYSLNKKLRLSFGVSIPTGSTSEEVTMNGNVVHAPYAMQLGSGTLDLTPSVTYSGATSDFGYGVQASYTVRTGENDEGYTLGNKGKIDAWGNWELTKSWVTTLSLSYLNSDSIDGSDSQILPMAPTGVASFSGGQRMDLSFGLAYTYGKKHIFGLEYANPILQDVDGIQMKAEQSVNFTYKLIM